MNKKILLPLILALCGCLSVSAQQVAVKTNLVMWATTTPNIGIEVALNHRSTISLEANYNPWTLGTQAKIQHWFIRPEYRYWLTEKFTRSFIGFHIIGGKYEIGGFKMPLNLFPNIQTHYYKGWAVGAGVTYGYHFYVSPHWNLELAVGVGYIRTEYDRHTIGGARELTLPRNYFGPTNASISFVYLFNSRK